MLCIFITPFQHVYSINNNNNLFYTDLYTNIWFNMISSRKHNCFVVCSFKIEFLIFTDDSSIFSKLILMLNVYISIYRQRRQIEGIYFYNGKSYVCNFIQKVN